MQLNTHGQAHLVTARANLFSLFQFFLSCAVLAEVQLASFCYIYSIRLLGSGVVLHCMALVEQTVICIPASNVFRPRGVQLARCEHGQRARLSVDTEGKLSIEMQKRKKGAQLLMSSRLLDTLARIDESW